jgi:hypothetical protein
LSLSVDPSTIEHMIDMVELLRTVSADAARLADAPRRESIDDFVQLVGDTQRLVSMVQAVQTLAVANVSAIEDVVDPGTGEVVEQFRGYGHHRMDAAALVSDELGVTARGAETRVGVAAQLAGRYPCVLEAMGQGRIDSYRASIIEHELGDAPDDTVEAVLAKVEPYLGTETGGRLRQRVRRVLGQVAAEFLRQKAVQARKDRSLQRWPGDGPGVDTWVASLPVEQSQKAWSAIDTLAREYVQAGHNSSIEQARADAMLAFIDGNARAEYVIQVAVPESRLNGALASVTEPPARQPQRPSKIRQVPLTGTSGAHADEPVGVGAGSVIASKWDSRDAANAVAHVGDVNRSTAAHYGQADAAIGCRRSDTDGSTSAQTDRIGPADTSPVATGAEGAAVDTADLDAWVRQVLRDTGIGQACATRPRTRTGPLDPAIPDDRSVDGRGNRDNTIGNGISGGDAKGKGRKRKKLRAADASTAATTTGLDRPVGLPALAPRRVRIDILPCDESTGAYTSTPVSSRTITPTRQDVPAGGSDNPAAMAANSRNGNAGSTGDADRAGLTEDTGPSGMTGLAGNAGSAGNVGSSGNTGVARTLGVAPIQAAFATAMVRRCAVPEPVVIGYRPTEAMIRTVKGRDGHCRFPGCTVSAKFCDLDHVSPWREGSTLTRVSNLICLCRRHHRTKQLRRWSVRMLPGAVVEWTDPTGRKRLTHPVNHLDPDLEPWLDPTGRPITEGHLNHTNASTNSADTSAPDGPGVPVELPSLLEEKLEYLTDHRERLRPQHRDICNEYGKPIGQFITPGGLWTVDLTDDYAAQLATRRTTTHRRSNADDPPPF